MTPSEQGFIESVNLRIAIEGSEKKMKAVMIDESVKTEDQRM